MKKLLTLISAILFGNLFYSYSQTQTYYYQGFLIGQSMSPPAFYPEVMMSEIEKIGSLYYLYFTSQAANSPGYIVYATSSDLTTWTVQDTIIYGVNDILNREFILGGARVIKTSGGQYRMFYRACQKPLTGQDPYYTIRSAISNDGWNFTPEGVRIEINLYDPASYFTHVGHSEFYYDQGGNLRALLTAEDTTMSTTSPDRIYTATSTDDGLTWSNFVPKYNQCHDPVVIKDSTGQYHAYFSYLNSGFRTVSSPNGTAWPTTPDTLIMMEGTSSLTESSSPKKIADLGATVNASGDIIITSNYQSSIGPWRHIAYFTNPTTSISENILQTVISVYPNPFSSSTTLQADNLFHNATLTVYNSFGQTVKQIKNISGQTVILSRDNLASGLYFVHFTQDSQVIARKKLFITD